MRRELNLSFEKSAEIVIVFKAQAPGDFLQGKGFREEKLLGDLDAQAVAEGNDALPDRSFADAVEVINAKGEGRLKILA